MLSSAAAARPRHVRQHNLGLLLHALRDLGPSTRTELAAYTGLTKMAVGRLAARLDELGLVTDGPDEAGRRLGRPASPLIIARSVVAFGVEITADSVLLVETNLVRGTRQHARVGLSEASPPDELAATVAELVDEACADALGAGKRIVGLGLALPALVDYPRQVVVTSSSLGWREVAFAGGVASSLAGLGLELPVVMDTRSNCHAIARADGADLGTVRVLAHLEVDLTVGAGFVIEGQLERGSRGHAGNVGHVPLHPDGPRCGCGNLGCLEALAGLHRLAALAGATAEEVAGGPKIPRDDLVTRIRTLATDGDARTLEAFADVGHWLGVGCVNLLHTMNPDVISLGGYPAELGEWLLPSVTRTVSRLAQFDYSDDCEITVSPDRTNIARGAASLVLSRLLLDPAAALATALRPE